MIEAAGAACALVFSIFLGATLFAFVFGALGGDEIVTGELTAESRLPQLLKNSRFPFRNLKTARHIVAGAPRRNGAFGHFDNEVGTPR